MNVRKHEVFFCFKRVWNWNIGKKKWVKYKLIILVFTKSKNSVFFQGQFWLTASEFLNGLEGNPFLRRVHDVHRQAGVGIQISKLYTQGVEITYNSMLFQCHDAEIITLFLTRVCRVIVWKHEENIHSRVRRCNLSKIRKLIFIALHLMKLLKLPKSCYSPKRR